MATEERPPTIAERYERASTTNDLTIKDLPCDADLLLAAAYAVTEPVFDFGIRTSTGEPMVIHRLIFPEKKMALDFYRLRVTGDMNGLQQLAQEAGAWLTHRTSGRRVTQGPEIHGVAAKDMAKRVILWWTKPTCPTCEGRGHPIIPGTPYIDETRDCEACHGTGETPVHRVVKPGHGDDARWLVGELNRLSAIVFSDMAAIIRPKLEL